MSARDPEIRRQIAAIAAYTKHSRFDGREATTAARHAAHVTRFEDAVDPERILDPVERARRVVAARKAYFRTLALKSARSRRSKSPDQ